jgi:hypothetical protein
MANPSVYSVAVFLPSFPSFAADRGIRGRRLTTPQQATDQQDRASRVYVILTLYTLFLTLVILDGLLRFATTSCLLRLP